MVCHYSCKGQQGNIRKIKETKTMKYIKYPTEHKLETMERVYIAKYRNRRLQYRIPIEKLTNERLLRLLKDITGREA